MESFRCKAEFLVQLDGFVQHNEEPVLFLGTTNLPWTIDPGLLRRFQRVVCMDLPDLESRRAILRQNLRQMLPPKSIAIKAASIDFDGLGSATEGFSGSDLHTACANATKKMLRRQISLKSGRANDGLANCQLTTADIQASLSQVRPLALAWRKRYDVWFRQKSIPSCSVVQENDITVAKHGGGTPKFANAMKKSSFTELDNEGEKQDAALKESVPQM